MGPPWETKYTGVRAMVDIGLCEARRGSLVTVEVLKKLLNLVRARISDGEDMANTIESTMIVTVK